MSQTLGIVFSGGGTRGLAHIGVLRALLERDIRPMRVAGTSAGAIVGALYAAGYSPAEMLHFFKTRSPFRFSNVSLTKPGLLDTTKVVSAFQQYFPGDSFESLNVPLSIVATDILAGSSHIFTTGPLIPAILASCSVPMVFTPTEIDGHWYSDGGIVNNFPVELVKQHCAVSLGIYVNPIRALVQDDLRSSLAVLQRSMEIGMYQAARAKFDQCDLVISPEGLGRFRVFDTKHLSEIEAMGYQAALAAMDRLESLLG